MVMNVGQGDNIFQDEATKSESCLLATYVFKQEPGIDELTEFISQTKETIRSSSTQANRKVVCTQKPHGGWK